MIMNEPRSDLCPHFGALCDFSTAPLSGAEIDHIIYACRRNFDACYRYRQRSDARRIAPVALRCDVVAAPAVLCS